WLLFSGCLDLCRPPSRRRADPERVVGAAFVLLLGAQHSDKKPRNAELESSCDGSSVLEYCKWPKGPGPRRANPWVERGEASHGRRSSRRARRAEGTHWPTTPTLDGPGA
ncbi:unnamed protein product, partial [Symbiodinium sp. CCMP2456]